MMIGHGMKLVSLAGLLTLTPAAVFGGGVHDYDFDWAVIGEPGNTAYDGSFFEVPSAKSMMAGRGAVEYSYRISKLEITTGQWLEFVNLFAPQMDDRSFGEPSFWGARKTGPGRHTLFTDPVFETPELHPVLGITWREAAMYANWLHNDKATSLDAIMDGAYDVSSFGDNPDGTFSDQLTRNPDAKFWIPSLDEWMKAAYYDPNKHGENKPGWWAYPTTSDTAPVSGTPEEGGESSVELDETSNGLSAWRLPLGSYTDIRSPWGLWDLSGGASEWTEESLHNEARLAKGWYAGGGYFGKPQFFPDHIDSGTGDDPGTGFIFGLRIAGVVPSPTSTVPLAVMSLFIAGRRKRE